MASAPPGIKHHEARTEKSNCLVKAMQNWGKMATRRIKNRGNIFRAEDKDVRFQR